MSPELAAFAKEAHAKGLSYTDIASVVGVAPSTVRRWLTSERRERRPTISDRIAAILNAAPVRSGWRPDDYTYRNLATEVYGADEPTEPTAAQLSAVRRAVAALVAEGEAERLGRDKRGMGDQGTHVRQRGGIPYIYENPAGVRVRRPMTDAEHEAREELRVKLAEERAAHRGRSCP
jgi:transcriptional regulator with XRE-family HTH domain